MAEFLYTTADKSGRIIKGKMEADTEQMVINALRDMNYFPVDIRSTAPRSKTPQRYLSFPVRLEYTKVRKSDLITLARDLANLLDAGTTLDRSLSILLDQIQSKKWKNIVQDIQDDIRAGGTLSNALMKYDHIFPPLYIYVIQAGEASGELGKVLMKLSEVLEEEENLKRYVQSSLLYPILMTVVATISVLFLLLFVIPKFASILESAGRSLPLPTQILLGTSHFIIKYWPILLILATLIISLISFYAKTRSGKLFFESLKIKIPVINDLYINTLSARFSRIFGILIGNDVHVLQSVQIVKNALDSEILSRVLSKAYLDIEQGKSIGYTLKHDDIFPSLLTNLIVIGEETGRLDAMLFKAADIYEKALKRKVDMVIALLEPILILIMGLIVGFIVVSMLLGIFSVNEIPL